MRQARSSPWRTLQSSHFWPSLERSLESCNDSTWSKSGSWPFTSDLLEERLRCASTNDAGGSMPTSRSSASYHRRHAGEEGILEGR